MWSTLAQGMSLRVRQLEQSAAILTQPMKPVVTAASPPGDTLRLSVPGPRSKSAIEVRPRSAEHPLLGLCDVAAVPGGPPLSLFSAVDWQAPRAIPAMDRPAALPSGAGSAILNHLARRAAAAGSPPLRYVGPYPTSSLFDTLLTCFRPEVHASSIDEARARFTANVEELATTGTVREVLVNFWPDPFTRIWTDSVQPGPPVCVQVRRGVEAIYVGGRAYRSDRSRPGPRRVLACQPEGNDATAKAWRAVIEIGGRAWAEIARVDATGTLLDGPHPIPPVENALVGKALPVGVRRALRAALPERAPGPLRLTLGQVIADTPLIWSDTGDASARIREGRVEVHAALPEMYTEDSAGALLTELSLVLEPVFQRMAQARLAAAFASVRDHIL